MNTLFRLTHYYNIGNQDLFFVSSVSPERLFELAAYIQLRAEMIIDEGISLETKEHSEILFQFIDVIQVPTFEKVEAVTIEMYEVRERFASILNELDERMKELIDLKILDNLIRNSKTSLRIQAIKTKK